MAEAFHRQPQPMANNPKAKNEDSEQTQIQKTETDTEY
jgi:hypothetical protein